MQLTMNIIMTIISGMLMIFISTKLFQILQLSSYKLSGYFNWFKITKFDYFARYFTLAFISFICMFVFIGCFSTYGAVKYIGFLFYLGLGILFLVLTGRQQKKTPLVLTARMLRMIVIAFFIYLGLSFLAIFLGNLTPLKYSLVSIVPFLAPLIVVIAFLITLPFELMNNYGFKTRAKKKLALMPQLIRIGITGSYGKTTAKNFLAQMLMKDYKVCFSPASYNTPMGLSKVINNSLQLDDQVFIAEMGARNVGDIKELAVFIQPNFGLITAIGNQHLETFGSRENIIGTKYELIENLAAGGLAVMNGDSADVLGMYNKCTGAKILTGSEDILGTEVTYKNVVTTCFGTTFDLNIGEKTLHLTTKLLGKHIPSVITLCAALAFNMGVKLEHISDAVENLAAVPHRLELIDKGKTTIIDDAYNSNCEGALNALLVLKQFEKYKVIITPGIVELGQEQTEANKTFGKQIAQNCDKAILVGGLGVHMKAGALEGGMKPDDIILVNSLNEGVEQLKSLPEEKVVLFENDLPDNY